MVKKPATGPDAAAPPHNGSKAPPADKKSRAAKKFEEGKVDRSWWGTKDSSKRGGGWPWWLWALGGFALVVSLGRVCLSVPAPPKRSAKVAAKATKTPKKNSGSSKKSTGGGSSSGSAGSAASGTMRFLELAMRLQEMTDVASKLQGAGALDIDAGKELEQECANIESELEGSEDPVARDLRAMVSVVRGTIAQKSQNLTDEEVEARGDAYTYANPRYWDDYYNKLDEKERFDWYGSWDSEIEQTQFTPQGASSPLKATELGHVLQPYMSPTSKIMMLGCGHSDMSEKMYRAGLEQIVNVDISEKLLENLRTKLAPSMPNMVWQYANASDLPFDTESFDVTLDKGTFDAIEQNVGLLRAAAKEAYRTLRPGGVFLSITFNAAPVRVDNCMREAGDWAECTTHEFVRVLGSSQKETTYYVHACRRHAR